MKKTSQFLFALTAALLVVSATGCGKKKPKGELGRGQFADATLTGDQTGFGPGSTRDGVPGSESGLAPGESPWGSTARDATGTFREELGGEMGALGMPVPELATVYFDLDRYDLDSAATAILERNTSYLQSKGDLYVILRGHTDDLGTEEYNISLGSRRAQTVRDYLADKGVSPERLQTVNFGESLKAVDGTDEASRARNRRVEFFVYTLED